MFNQNHLRFQEGKMAIAAVATQLVCMVSKNNVQLGMLKAKVIPIIYH